jgi:hypothetical protein
VTVTDDGTGTYEARTYQDCTNAANRNQDLPCEDPYGSWAIRTSFRLVQQGGAVVARITESNVKGVHGDVPVSVKEPGILTYAGDDYCDGAVISDDRSIQVCG